MRTSLVLQGVEVLATLVHLVDVIPHHTHSLIDLRLDLRGARVAARGPRRSAEGLLPDGMYGSYWLL